jgi:hypothetical protein
MKTSQMFATSVVSVEHGMTVSAIIDPGNRSRAAAVPLTPHARYKIKRDATTSLHRLTALQWQPGALVELADDGYRGGTGRAGKTDVGRSKTADLWRRHCDIEEAALLLDIIRISCRLLRGNATVDHVKDECDLPFLALGRVDGRQD